MIFFEMKAIGSIPAVAQERLEQMEFYPVDRLVVWISKFLITAWFFSLPSKSARMQSVTRSWISTVKFHHKGNVHGLSSSILL
jgi:hypothetical protein